MVVMVVVMMVVMVVMMMLEGGEVIYNLQVDKNSTYKTYTTTTKHHFSKTTNTLTQTPGARERSVGAGNNSPTTQTTTQVYLHQARTGVV